MRTVKQITSYSYYSWLNNSGYKQLVNEMQLLEDNNFIVQQVHRTGTIRVKLPEWYVLKQNEIELFDLIAFINELMCQKFNRHISYLCIGAHSFYIRTYSNANR